MAKDKKKSKEAKKAVVAKKQQKSAQKATKKTSKKKDDLDSDAEDADLDAILAEYQKQQEQFLKVTEISAEPPSPRSSATVLANPSNANELFLFGGEYYNGATAQFWNDLFVYKANTDSWRKVNSPNSPLPRSGHAWCAGANAGGIWLFGGEFSSPKQGTFYHYNDFWRLEPSTREWSKIDTKGGPPARSGHRMVGYKNYIVIFGGFQDTSQTTKYLPDLWLYDTQNFKWLQPTLPPASPKPDARSSFSLLPHDTGAVLYGGYSRVKATASTSKSSKSGKGSSSNSTRVVLKPFLHQDTWILRITPPASEAPPNTPPTVRWERRKKPVNTPAPARAGVTMAHHKGRGILFGGVHDVEESEEGIESEFFNQLFAWNIDRNRFFPLALRRGRAAGAKKGPAVAKRGRGKADEEELLRNLAMIEGKGDELTAASVLGMTADADEEVKAIEKPTLWEFPHPRFNAQLAVLDDTLFIYGGTFEKGDREFTFDELWSIDLGKLDGVREVFKREIADWQGDESSDSEEDDEDDSEYDEDDDEGVAVDGTATPATTEGDDGGVPLPPIVGAEAEEEESTPTPVSSQSDGLPYPRPFENLRAFFERTSHEWQELVLLAKKYERTEDIAERSVKEIRATAFKKAEGRWWDVREEVQILEDEQEAAGVGEVVSLADRGGEGGGARGRR
ncbi:Kelch repeat-containing protein 3 [Oleoguttula sp. CCFEE 5521]